MIFHSKKSVKKVKDIIKLILTQQSDQTIKMLYCNINTRISSEVISLSLLKRCVGEMVTDGKIRSKKSDKYDDDVYRLV